MDLEAARESDLAVARDLGYAQATEDLTTASCRIVELEARIAEMEIELEAAHEQNVALLKSNTELRVDAKMARARLDSVTKQYGEHVTKLSLELSDQEARLAEVTEPAPTHRHWKGGLYRRLHDATIEGTMEAAVVYQSCPDGRIWVRPKADFEEWLTDADDPDCGFWRFAPLSAEPRP